MTVQAAQRTLTKILPYIRAGYPLVFQGGEPLLAGHEYFETIFSLLETYGVQAPVFIQTNGTLLDWHFAHLFAKYGVLVGVSLDGNRKTHGFYRQNFDRVMNGIRCLQEADCEFNILTVVTNELAERVDEVWAYYRENTFDFQQYIPCMTQHEVSWEHCLDNEHYGNFLCRLFDLWKIDYEQGRYVYIRFFENILLLLSGCPAEECGANGICSPQFLIEANGDVYPCDFYVEPKYRLGNLIDDSPEVIEQRLMKTDFIASSVSMPEKCTSCRYLHLCRGGCKRYRDANGLFIYCDAYRQFFSHALKPMFQLLDTHFGRNM